MSVEIELKAWADDPGQVRETLSRIAEYGGTFVKEDAYWYPLGSGHPGGFPESGLRIRRERTLAPGGGEDRAALVTFKTKEVRDGIEVNREREFRVDGAALEPDGSGPLEELLGLLGLAPGIRKRKKGDFWHYRGITAELLELEGLGFFLELEIIAGDDSPETIRDARERLLELLALARIGRDRIETRYYTEMLRENGA